MNADETPNPKLTDESWAEPEAPNSSPVSEQNSTAPEPLLESGLNSATDKEKIFQPESPEDSDFEFLVELEEQIAQAESEVDERVGSEAQPTNQTETELTQRVADLHQQEQALKQEIARLQASQRSLSEQVAATQTTMGRVIQEALVQLEQRKQALQITVEQLERRQERIRKEMRTTFAGASQDLAIRVQGFKDYLTGSLQDLATAAEQLELVPRQKAEPQQPEIETVQPAEVRSTATPQFTEQRFESTTKQIRRLLDQYRNQPDYYGPPWQLRRTFEPVHAERVSNWFFTQGGRGALRTMGSRLQNILISSAIISVLYEMYEDSLRTLVLANTPERLGDWRRGLQDCLGIARGDFGPERGVVLFESPEAVALKAERVIKDNEMPLIIIDDSEDVISLSLLQFPLWLAFAPDPRTARDRDFDF